MEKALKELIPRDTEELRQKVQQQVPEQYLEYADVFSKADSDTMPPQRSARYEHKLDLVEGKSTDELGYSSLYKMSVPELEACRTYITENLQKGFIESSDAPWAAPVLFAPKSDGSLRFCVDYRKLNAITRKDQYPLPLIDKTLSRIIKVKVLTKIDIR